MKSEKRAARAYGMLLGCWCLLGLGMLGAWDAQLAQAAGAPSRQQQIHLNLPACAPCITAISPAPGSTVQTDSNGNVTISATAQLLTNYTQFTFAIDQMDVPASQVQVTGDAMNPTATVVAPLTNGKHHVFAQVFDATRSY